MSVSTRPVMQLVLFVLLCCWALLMTISCVHRLPFMAYRPPNFDVATRGGAARHSGKNSTTRVLLIIHGQYRTFDLCVDSVLRNIADQNNPCDIVLVVDGPENRVSEPTRTKLAAYRPRYFFREPGDVRKPGYISEFWQVKKVLDRVDLSGYTHIIKTRTDAYVRHPLRFLVALGQAPPSVFAESWEHFVKYFPSDISLGLLLQHWFMSGGDLFFVPSMVEQPPRRMIYFPLTPRQMNEAFLKRVEDGAHGLLTVGDEKNPEKIQAWIARVARENHLMYMLGSTWVHFGARDDFVTASQSLFSKYPKLFLKDVLGFPVNSSMGIPNNWDHWTTETHFRSLHVVLKYALVDLQVVPDYIASFTARIIGYPKLTRSETLCVFLLRHWQVVLGEHVFRKKMVGLTAVQKSVFDDPSKDWGEIRGSKVRADLA